MTRKPKVVALVAAAALALAGASVAQAATPSSRATVKPSNVKHTAQPTAQKKNPLGKYKHVVVIYEENHSFDNLYGGWGKVDGKKVIGLQQAKAGTTQVDQAGTPITCLYQNDANLITTSQTT